MAISKATITWQPNIESDLAGYNVYRQVETGAFVKITALLIPKGTTVYVDSVLPTGTTYTYNVTAVDISGNESLHSGNVSKVNDVVPPAAPVILDVVLS
jgi:fibronectin type 3 domain-containing protein